MRSPSREVAQRVTQKCPPHDIGVVMTWSHGTHTERMIQRRESRFAHKIMRHQNVSARSDAKPVTTFADRALVPHW